MTRFILKDFKLTKISNKMYENYLIFKELGIYSIYTILYNIYIYIITSFQKKFLNKNESFLKIEFSSNDLKTNKF
jgi:hypothetical protein